MLRLRNLIILLIILSGLSLEKNLYASESVYLKDTVIGRTGIYSIPVFGSISTNASSLEIVLSFNAHVIDINSVSGGKKFAIKDSIPGYSVDLSRLDSSLITISSNNIQAVDNGIICTLNVRGLFYSDSNCPVIPQAMYIDSQQIKNASFGAGKIIVRGNLVVPYLPDNLSFGVPNPSYSGLISFNFSLGDSSYLKFSVFNLAGALVTASDDGQGMFSVFTDDLSRQISDISRKIEKGKYALRFYPDVSKIANGMYFIVMRTDRGIYNTNFILAK
jgi:hypothetical protein